MIRVGWLLVAVAAAAIIGWRFQPVVDLAWFLPGPGNAEEQVLLEQLGQGPGSRLLFIAVAAKPDTGIAELGELSEAVAAELRESQQFSSVINGPLDPDIDAIPDIVWTNRYLLTEPVLDDQSLRNMLRERRADMAVIGEAWMAELIAADPPLAALTVLGAAQPVGGGELHWLDAAANRAMLIAETRAPAFELAGQTAAVNLVRGLDLGGLESIEVHGMGVYSVDLQDTIRAEATARSVAASVAVLLILLLAYRRPGRVLAGFLPLLLGALSALAMIALLFGKVHGITLAFGFTLLGVTVDYPLHFLSHTRDACTQDELRSMWRTLRISMLSTALAFLAIAAGGSTGLAQIGVFSATGVLVVYTATRTLLPVLCPPSFDAVDTAQDIAGSGSTRLLPMLWAAALVAGVALLATLTTPHWTDDLSAVSPVPPEQIKRDRELRRQFGAPDLSLMIAVRDPRLEATLQSTEQLAGELEDLKSDGALTDFRPVTNLVPSEATQAARIGAAANAGDLAERIDAVAVALGFRAGVFAPFVAAVNATAATTRFLGPDDYRGSELENLVAANLYEANGAWVSLTTLSGVVNPGQLRTQLRTAGAQLIDIKSASVSLMQRYREQVLLTVLTAAGIIAVYLWFMLRSIPHTIWVLGTLLAAQALTLVISSFMLGTLSIFNLIAAVLVAGLGIDYALFFARSEPNARAAGNTRHAVAICALSTCGAFTILAFSAIPILQSIGVTVATGVACSYGLARFGRRVY